MTISIIAAIGKNRELGYGKDLIWKIPNDLARFKTVTSGHPIIMGRKTYESIGRILPDRTNIIITRNSEFKVDGAVIVNSLEQAIEKAKGEHGSDEIFIIGGSQIFNQAIKIADKLYLTKINSEAPLADVFFPEYPEFIKETFREAHEDDSLQYEFVNLER